MILPSSLKIQDEYNQRPHSKLGRTPEQMFQEEKPHLLKLPTIEPAMLQFKEARRVNDGYISHDGNLYPVPMRYATKAVWIEIIYGRSMKIYDEKGTLLNKIYLCLEKQTTRPIHRNMRLLIFSIGKKKWYPFHFSPGVY